MGTRGNGLAGGSPADLVAIPVAWPASRTSRLLFERREILEGDPVPFAADAAALVAAQAALVSEHE